MVYLESTNGRAYLNFIKSLEILSGGDYNPHRIKPLELPVYFKEKEVDEKRYLNGTILMVDEIHCDFIFPGHTFFSCMQLDKKYHKILAFYTSPGKTFNIAGLQAANIIIPDPELRAKYRKANTAAGYSQANIFGQVGLIACYTKGAEWVDQLVEYIYGNVQYAKAFIGENLPKAVVVDPDGTYLLWVDFSAYGFSKEELEHLIVDEAKLWLDSGAIFGPATALFERFNLACPRSVVEEAMQRLKRAFEAAK